jgi:two-component system nitrogen regulation sensor histidine kinase NtrY
LEPYVTKRDKGTGLGLAIVSKIIQDHGGELDLLDAGQGGAQVVISLPCHDEPETGA